MSSENNGPFFGAFTKEGLLAANELLAKYGQQAGSLGDLARLASEKELLDAIGGDEPEGGGHER